jgi:hypothetical protein
MQGDKGNQGQKGPNGQGYGGGPGGATRGYSIKEIKKQQKRNRMFKLRRKKQREQAGGDDHGDEYPVITNWPTLLYFMSPNQPEYFCLPPPIWPIYAHKACPFDRELENLTSTVTPEQPGYSYQVELPPSQGYEYKRGEPYSYGKYGKDGKDGKDGEDYGPDAYDYYAPDAYTSPDYPDAYSTPGYPGADPYNAYPGPGYPQPGIYPGGKGPPGGQNAYPGRGYDHDYYGPGFTRQDDYKGDGGDEDEDDRKYKAGYPLEKGGYGGKEGYKAPDDPFAHPSRCP